MLGGPPSPLRGQIAFFGTGLDCVREGSEADWVLRERALVAYLRFAMVERAHHLVDGWIELYPSRRSASSGSTCVLSCRKLAAYGGTGMPGATDLGGRFLNGKRAFSWQFQKLGRGDTGLPQNRAQSAVLDAVVLVNDHDPALRMPVESVTAFVRPYVAEIQ